ncbi:unnamed protein product [Hapterophycus canaliculatus]
MMAVWNRHDSPPATEKSERVTSEGSEERVGAARQTKARSAEVASQEGEDMCFVYPILQPPPSRRSRNGKLPWSGEESRTFLRFSVFFANPFNSLMDALQGQVVIPVSALAGKEREGGAQPEVRGWFDVSPVEDDLQSMAALTLPDGGGAVVSEEDKQASLALQTLLGEEEDARHGEDLDGHDKALGGSASSRAAGGGSGGGGDGGVDREVARDAAVAAAVGGGGAVARLLGMPMGLRNTVRDVQDTIGTVLDAVEAVKNLLNWTHPPKTLMVYTLVAIAWLVLLVIPGRYIVLALGLLEFSKVWMAGAQEPGRGRGGSVETPPLAIKLRNLLMSLPVDSELAACYSWEAREYSKKEKAARKLREQRAKLKLLGAGRQWEGAMRVRDRTGDPWESSRHVVLLGHRLAWWGSAQELDEGRKARGQLLLQGHAGITHLSPVEARELSDPKKAVCVFGRSPDGLPHKVSFMGETVADKDALENAVTSAVETKRD